MSLITNLISYWKLDETSGTRADSHGANTLSNTNGVSYGAGIINNGADFELSSSQYLSITDGSQTGLDISGDWSFSCWIKLESLPTPATNLFGIMGKFNTTGDKRAYSINIEDSSALRCSVYQDGTTTNRDIGITNAALFSAGDIGNLVHLVVTYDLSARDFTVYKNNVDTATTTTPSGTMTGIYNNTESFKIGKFNTAAIDDYFDGIIDEVGIWSKVLTSDEVTELYNSGAGLAYSDFETDKILIAETGVFAMTGNATIFNIGYQIIASVGSFLMTGYNAVLKQIGWTNQSKPSTTFANDTKASSTFTNETKPSTTFTNQSK